MRKRILAVVTAAAVLAVSGARAQDLNVGDDAPKIEVKEFVKGEPVKQFEKGKVYVVEFWATWCGPCIVSIPHISELQKQHKDKVTVVGVSVWERDQGGVKPFVEKMGDKMSYRVAMDDVGQGGGNDGKMAKAWMAAAGQQGIPTAFVVNGDGKIAWIGHPMQMDKPLAQIVEGKWDLKAAAREHKQAQAARGKLTELRGKLAAAMRDKDFKGAVALIDEAAAENPALGKMLAPQKFQLLTRAGDGDKTLQFARKIVEGEERENAELLNFVAWTIVDPDSGFKPDKKLLALALDAARKADELTKGKNGAIADTLAKAYFDNGDVAKAIEHQERAIKLAEGTELANDKSLQKRLEQYRKEKPEK
jgi:thiol-disulfide isomerase/thioredoxin